MIKYVFKIIDRIIHSNSGNWEKKIFFGVEHSVYTLKASCQHDRYVFKHLRYFVIWQTMIRTDKKYINTESN